MVASSHEIQTVEGVLSGTLAFVLGAVAGGAKTLSAAVAEAKELGFTEPDPRDDLNGMDVARKAVILARVAGLKAVELESMDIESLVPEPLRECSVEEFMAGLPAHDEAFAARVAAVEAKGERLHYAGKVDMRAGVVTVGPLACAVRAAMHPAAPAPASAPAPAPASTPTDALCCCRQTTHSTMLVRTTCARSRPTSTPDLWSSRAP